MGRYNYPLLVVISVASNGVDLNLRRYWGRKLTHEVALVDCDYADARQIRASIEEVRLDPVSAMQAYTPSPQAA